MDATPSTPALPQGPAPAPRQGPQLLRLFETYTAGPGSIGAKLTEATVRATAGDPLVVATSSDFILYPGNGAAPEVEGFRLGTRGFKELAAVSHLPPAIASILRLRELEPASDLWRSEAERLLAATAAARQENSVALWRDRIAVAAWRGREERIAALVQHSCEVTERYLQRALDHPALFTADDLRRHYLEASGDAVGARLPMNRMMVATFFLVGMDIGHRVIGWFDRHAIDWQRAMVVIAGRHGRPTAGVTWTSSSVCAMVLAASGHRLPLERVYLAPHAPLGSVAQAPEPAAVAALEAPMRQLWCHTRATSELAPLMFQGLPRYAAASAARPVLAAGVEAVSEMPAITGPDDWHTMTTRLRLVLEDPRQLLSGCVTDYAVDQLRACGNDPSRVIVPGLDNEDF